VVVPPATQLGCVQPFDRERRNGVGGGGAMALAVAVTVALAVAVTVDGVGGGGGGKLGSWVALEVAWAGVGAKVVDAV